MTWPDKLISADLRMSMHALKSGQAELRVRYYGERSGIVRRRLIIVPEETDDWVERVYVDD